MRSVCIKIKKNEANIYAPIGSLNSEHFLRDMLFSHQCVAVIVDSQPSGSLPPPVDSILRILSCAKTLSIPILHAHYPADLTNGVLQTLQIVPADIPSIPFDPAAPDWRTTALAASLHATGRRQVLLAGLWLEEAVSLLAEHTIRIGFDTYVSVDASPAVVQDQSAILRARLSQHGVVVTTTEQVLREWLALSNAKRTSDAAP